MSAAKDRPISAETRHSQGRIGWLPALRGDRLPSSNARRPSTGRRISRVRSVRLAIESRSIRQFRRNRCERGSLTDRIQGKGGLPGPGSFLRARASLRRPSRVGCFHHLSANHSGDSHSRMPVHTRWFLSSEPGCSIAGDGGHNSPSQRKSWRRRVRSPVLHSVSCRV